MFYKKVDKKSREEMISFLRNHYRYYTANSWNKSTSYAHNVKLHRLNIPKHLNDIAYELILLDEVYDDIRMIMDDFAQQYNYQYQMGFNGRSGGYIVLYTGGTKPSGYKSYCTVCGQRNYTSVKETGHICGACNKDARVDYKIEPKQIYTYPGRGIDEDENFEEWGIESLRWRVNIIQNFDKTVDQIRDYFICMCEHYTVEEETIFVPKKIKVLKEVS